MILAVYKPVAAAIPGELWGTAPGYVVISPLTNATLASVGPSLTF